MFLGVGLELVNCGPKRDGRTSALAEGAVLMCGVRKRVRGCGNALPASATVPQDATEKRRESVLSFVFAAKDGTRR